MTDLNAGWVAALVFAPAGQLETKLIADLCSLMATPFMHALLKIAG